MIRELHTDGLLACVLLAPLLSLAGCGGTDACENDDCPPGQTCERGACAPSTWRFGADAGAPARSGPDIDVPAELELEAEAPGETVRRTFPVRNVGDEPLRVHYLVAGNASAFRFSPSARSKSPPRGQDLPVAFSVGPGDSAQVQVEFTPRRARSYSVRLGIASNDPDPQEEVVFTEIRGNVDNGGDSGPCVDWSPRKTLDLGTTPVGSSTAETVTISNCSESDPLMLRRPGASPTPPFQVRDSFDKRRVDPGGSVALEVEYQPRTPNAEENGTFKVETDTEDQRTVEVQLTGRVENNGDCPRARASVSPMGGSNSGSKVTTQSLQTVVLDGTNSSARKGRVAKYHWSIVRRPKGSTARLTPSSTTEKPKLQPDLVGTYDVELEVTDATGTRSCNTASVTVRATARSGLYIEMFWRNPKDNDPTDDSGADFDLHYLNPKASAWNKSPWDIYWDNQTADWGSKSSNLDDPELVAEETDGQGPESISHRNPSTGKRYQVGVYYYDEKGFGPGYASVRIYARGNRIAELLDKKMSQYWFWKVGLVEWPTANWLPRDRIFKSGFPTNP